MKFLLTAVNAKYIHSNPAVYILRAYAAEYRDHIAIAEYTINNRVDAILADLYDRQPDVLAFSCYIWNWNLIRELLVEIPKVLPHTDIWLGGPEVSYDAPRVLTEFPQLSGIMVGEGEETFRELAGYYLQRDTRSLPTPALGASALSDIAGLCLPGNPPRFTGVRKPVDLDAIPFFYEDLQCFENRILYYESSRGCPFSCSYCLSSIDKQVRLRSLGLVLPELQFFLDHKVPQVKFIDRTFNCNHAHACAIWRYILEHDNGITNFHFEISADILTDEELAILRQMRPGLIQLEIGVQSTNETTIKEIRRTMDLDRLRRVVAEIHAMRNTHQHLDLIAGLPYEDFESFVKSFNDVYDMKPDQLQLGFLKVLKGSFMEEQAAAYDLVYRSTPPYEVLSTRWLSYGQILRLGHIEEMVELFYNSCQFVHTLEVLVLAFASPFEMYDRLVAYYIAHGYDLSTPARSYRYELLLAFAVEHDPAKEALYRELLTYDIYLRENCKSRPSFACDLSCYKEQLRSISKDRTKHVDVFWYPVWETEAQKKTERSATASFVLFDYGQRDPLSHNAKTTPYQG